MQDTIDRITPTQRPRGLVVNRQKWRNLLFLHWSIPVSQLRPHVPDALEIDTFDGNAYVGLVPFSVAGARAPFTPPLPFVSTFHEVNVRTYVHYEGRDPGVFFFTLDASSPIVVRAARSIFHLAYRDASIRVIPLQPFGTGFDYATTRPDESAGMHLIYSPEGELRIAQPGTLEFFLIERYVLYASDHTGLYRGRVHHAPYELRDASVRLLEETLLRACGLLRPQSSPLVHYSFGVDTEIFALKKLTRGA